MIKVKVCGITNLDDAKVAVELGADALGFVFAPSPRQVTRELVSKIVGQLPPLVCKVGVFVDAGLEWVKDIMSACCLDLAQLHGNESPEYCEALFPRAIKAFRVRDSSVLNLLLRYKAIAYLLDSYDVARKGGTGSRFDWVIARDATQYGRIILAGGINPDNVRQAIVEVRPYALDVSSGVEASLGKKDYAKLRSFLATVKEMNVLDK